MKAPNSKLLRATTTGVYKFNVPASRITPNQQYKIKIFYANFLDNNNQFDITDKAYVGCLKYNSDNFTNTTDQDVQKTNPSGVVTNLLLTSNTTNVFSYNFTVSDVPSVMDIWFAFGIAGANNNTFVNVPVGNIDVRLYRESPTNDADFLDRYLFSNQQLTTASTTGVYRFRIPAAYITNVAYATTNRQYKIKIFYNNVSYFTTDSTYIGKLKYNFDNITSTTLGVQQTSPSIFCLFEDTDVLTPSGYVSVKSLQVGDLVSTSDGRTSHIKRIWSSNMPLQEQFYPIIIKANSISENYPPKDCRLSKYHLINFNGNWITPYKNEHIFKYDREVKSIKYYHLELENYLTDNLVINGGLVVESLGNENKESGLEWVDRVNNSIIL